MATSDLKPAKSYVMSGYKLDENRRSMWTTYEVPLKQTSPLSAMSEKQVGMDWGLGLSQNSPPPHNFDEMHITNRMGIVWVMAGHLESSIQSGERRRRATGTGNFVHGWCLHHSHMSSITPTATLSLNLTNEVTEGYEFK